MKDSPLSGLNKYVKIFKAIPDVGQKNICTLHKVAEKQKVYVLFQQQTHAHTGGQRFSERARRPRIVDDLGAWELKSTKSKMARGRQQEAGWFFSRFSSILQGQQRFQVDQTVKTVEGIVLRSFRNACGNGLP